jgi:carbon-monoxide dehydrogenase large subunit
MRLQDPVHDLLVGTAQFTGDLPPPDALHLAFVTSPVAHARIEMIDIGAAASAPGVVAVFIAPDLSTVPIHEIELIPERFAQPAIAQDEVRFVGEYVAAVLADTAGAAADAVELVVVDYTPLPAITDARENEDESALAWDTPLAADAFADAAITVRTEYTIPRVAVAPMEGRAALAVPGDDGSLTLFVSTQAPHWSRVQVARGLGLPVDLVRVIAPHVGGGFGGKAVGGVAAYVVTAAAARALRRPVRFVETRTANLQTMQGRGLRIRAALHARADGGIVGLEIDELCDAGAFPSTGAVEPGKTGLMACGPYRVPAVGFAARSVVTNLVAPGAYRGPGRAEAATVLERTLDLLARELDLDPVEVRRRNLLTRAELPGESVTGAHYDDGDLHAVLDTALIRADYTGWRAEQRRRRAGNERTLLGVGVATVLDSTAWFARQETADVRVLPDGRVRVTTGTPSAGQLHTRAYQIVVAGVLPVSVDNVEVVEGDTDAIPGSAGTSGSRALQLSGSAVHGAAVEVLEQARRLAADRLEAAVDDIVVTDRRFTVRGVPARGLTLAGLAAEAGPDAHALEQRCVFDQPDATYTGAAHVSVVEVDTETGAVTPRLHVAVTDCGVVVDPPSATGQVTGASAQGIAQACLEEFTYDGDGNPLTSTLADYLVPSAADLPPIDAAFVTTPATTNPLGARGVGEVGMVGAPAAVYSAVVDALAHIGVRHVDTPCTPERVWRAIRAARTTS